jgi:hypothetical protein
MPSATSFSAFRTLPTIAWACDGRAGLEVHIRRDVPWFDDLMIRSALVRSASACERLVGLDWAIHRELWALGYAARVEPSAGGGATVVVHVTPGC